MVRRVLLWFHRYLGLLATLPLILLGLSGAVLVFEGEIDRALNPTYWNVSPQGQPMPLQDLVRTASKSYPHDPVTGIHFPEKPTVAVELSLKSGLSLGVDPYTGAVLGARRRSKSIVTYIHQFHTRLLTNVWGRWVTGISTIAMLVLAITGLILWWRRKTFGIKWNAPWRRVIFDAHYAFGIWGFVPLLFIGLTGVAIGFETIVRPALYSITHSQPAPLPAMHSEKTTGPRLTIDAAVDVAHQALPGAAVIMLGLPSGPSGVYLTYMKFPEDHTPAGRSHVGFDQYSGKILWLDNARTSPTGTWLFNLGRPIHTGDIFGWPTRILACLASLALVAQAVSGVWLWWPRRRKSADQPADQSPADRSDVTARPALARAAQPGRVM